MNFFDLVFVHVIADVRKQQYHTLLFRQSQLISFAQIQYWKQAETANLTKSKAK